MSKKYIVRLSEQERSELTEIDRKLKRTSEKVRRAHILLKADADGPNWIDAKIVGPCPAGLEPSRISGCDLSRRGSRPS